ncbi:MAG: hypothetical protein JXR96_19885 [Deltaproteobacteria bacterium]|nr:hypothetical protein [Deltaproteobacteria bacterium]
MAIMLAGLPGSAAERGLVWPGMRLEDFRALRPGVVPDEIPFDRDLERQGRFGELDGRWQLEVRDGRLREACFCAAGQGIFALRDDAETRAELAAERERYKRKLGDLAGLLEQALGAPPAKTVQGPLANAAKGEAYQTRILHRASWKRGELEVSLRLRFLGEPGLQVSNAAASPLRHELCVTFAGIGAAGDVPGQRFHPGMPAAELARLEPALLPRGLAVKGQWGEKAELAGVAGEWTYDFEGGELDWVRFSRYWREDELTAESFAAGLRAARALIARYTAELGKPQASYEKSTRFRDPRRDHHWGYDVIEARWTKPRGKLKVGFDFHGGKGVYFLLLEVSVFRKDYPYFD